MESLRARDLIPGQWVVFADDETPIDEQLDNPFKVIGRFDTQTQLDISRWWLMSVTGQLVDYSPEVSMVGTQQISPRLTVKMISKEKMGELLADTIETLQPLALASLKHLAQFEAFAKGFDPDDETKALTGKEIRAKYGLPLREK